MGQVSSTVTNNNLPGFARKAIVEKSMPVNLHEDNSTWIYLYSVSLEARRQYGFSDKSTGYFLMTGGSCGYFTVELDQPTSYLTIIDSDGDVFIGDQPGLRVTVQDNRRGCGSSVIVTCCGNPAAKLPIPVYADVNKNIYFQADHNRNFTIIGSGACLTHLGRGNVTVNGDLGSLTLFKETGDVEVYGSVKGNIKVSDGDGYKITVDGNVEGTLFQTGGGIKGDLMKSIFQHGSGFIHIRGTHHKDIIKFPNGGGRIQVDTPKVAAEGGNETEETKKSSDA